MISSMREAVPLLCANTMSLYKETRESADFDIQGGSWSQSPMDAEGCLYLITSKLKKGRSVESVGLA